MSSRVIKDAAPRHERRRDAKGFNYVGIRQGIGDYIFSSWPFWLSPIGWALGMVKLVSTAKRPRRGHSTIRVLEVTSLEKAALPTHEITCGRIDAHSHSRALAVEAVAQNAGRAVEPRFSLRGPVNTHSSWIFLRRLLGGRRTIGCLTTHHVPQRHEQLTADGHGGGFPARAAADLQPTALDPRRRNGWPSRPPAAGPSAVAGAGLADVTVPLFSSRGEQAWRQSGVTTDGFAVGEAAEVAHFGQDGGGDDGPDARRGDQQRGRGGKSRTAQQPGDLALAHADLFLHETQLPLMLPEHAYVPLGQAGAVGFDVARQAFGRKPRGARAGCWCS